MRINVVGTSGSGKTALSRRIAEKLSIPHIEMDRLFWGPDWYGPADDEFFPRLEEELSQDSWVLDGNYTRTPFLKWKNIDMVIWVDFSFPRTIVQAIKRALSRVVTKEELWPGTGNRESIKQLFSSDSIVLWTIKSYKKNRRKYLDMMNDKQYEHIRFVRITSLKEVDEFVSSLAIPHAPAKVPADTADIC